MLFPVYAKSLEMKPWIVDVNGRVYVNATLPVMVGTFNILVPAWKMLAPPNRDPTLCVCLPYAPPTAAPVV
jgi:hypothetical protein